MTRWISKTGYVMLAIAEHRLVMERKLGRALREREVVHHRNGDRQDNRPENLRVFPSRAAHIAHHRRRRSIRLMNRYARYVAYVTGRPLDEVFEAMVDAELQKEHVAA